ncbi:hypothetical protein ACOSQ2_030867 [Xanthoceras sorbifolium]
MVSKSFGSDVAVGATQNVEDDPLLDRPVETDPEIQPFTDCGNDVMEVSVNAEEAVPDPPSIQVLPPVSTVIGAILKEEIRETLTVPICVESVKSGTFEGNRSGVPGGNEEGSVVAPAVIAEYTVTALRRTVSLAFQGSCSCPAGKGNRRPR